MPRKIKKAKIKFLSLVPKGANRLKAIYKEDTNVIEFNPLIKAAPDFDEKGELLAVVYAPNFVDAQGDFATEEVIKDAAYNFAKEKGGIDIRHNEKALPSEDVFVAESFIIQKDDSRFLDFPIDVTGGWGVVLKIENENLRKLYRENEWQGISMGGTAVIEQASEEDLKTVLKELLSEFKPMPVDEKAIELLTKELSEIKELLTKKEDKKEEAPPLTLSEKLKAKKEELILVKLEQALESEELSLEEAIELVEKIDKPKSKKKVSNFGLFKDGNSRFDFEDEGKAIAKELNEGKL